MAPTSFAVALKQTPLFNTPDMCASFGGSSGNEVPLDAQQLLRSVETVVFPGSKFRVLTEVSPHVVQVLTNEYNMNTDLFTDRRFLRFVDEEPTERKPSLPSLPELLTTMESLMGTRYIWGGVFPGGVQEIAEYYPPKIELSQLDPLIADTWTIKGVDCSGLLHYASNGFTPRNTAHLVSYGNPVCIEGKSAEEIAAQVNDLDLIVWKGHVVIVFDKSNSIESLLGHGVIKQPLVQRLQEIMHEKKRRPVNDYETTEHLGDRFVVRRWHPDTI